jgi:Fe-S-cluster containining protein
VVRSLPHPFSFSFQPILLPVIRPSEYPQLEKRAAKSLDKWKKFHQKNKKKLESMDRVVHELHDTHAQAIDCLECARCCKGLGPRITDKDVERMADALRIKPSAVVETYLRTDEDGDLVFRTLPCPFLDADNYCVIYESRPKACREYPHLDRKRFFQLYSLSVKNASTCPIVYEVLEALTR